MLGQWKQRLADKRITKGDGRTLSPFRWWNLLSGRSLFYLVVGDELGGTVNYAVDVRLFGWRSGDEGMLHLFRNDRHWVKSTLPASVRIEGGYIEAAVGAVGLKKMRFISDDGEVRSLEPDPNSGSGRRLRFAREHPTASRRIGVISVIVLFVGVGLNLVQILEPIMQIPPFVEQFGRWESPIKLPLWLNVALGVAAAAAGTERAYRLRYHWLLDGLGT